MGQSALLAQAGMVCSCIVQGAGEQRDVAGGCAHHVLGHSW